MAAIRARLLAAVAKRENIVSGLLLGTFVALCFRSSEQQREIDALEAEKSSLRAAVTAMSSSMWSWRQDLFALAADAAKDTSSTRKPYIPLPRLRAIYGEGGTTLTLGSPPISEWIGCRKGTNIHSLTVLLGGDGKVLP